MIINNITVKIVGNFKKGLIFFKFNLNSHLTNKILEMTQLHQNRINDMFYNQINCKDDEMISFHQIYH